MLVNQEGSRTRHPRMCLSVSFLEAWKQNKEKVYKAMAVRAPLYGSETWAKKNKTATKFKPRELRSEETLTADHKVNLAN